MPDEIVCRTMQEIIEEEAARTPEERLRDEAQAGYRESAYRRGFHQGAFAVLKSIRDGAPLALMDIWLDEVAEWRFQHDGRGRDVSPPPTAP